MATAGTDVPRWLRLCSWLTLRGLDALAAGGSPAVAMSEATAGSDADVGALEDALERLAVWQRFLDLANACQIEAGDLAARIEQMPAGTLETLAGDCSWIAAELSARPDIRSLAANLAGVCESAQAGAVDHALHAASCQAAAAVRESENKRRDAA